MDCEFFGLYVEYVVYCVMECWYWDFVCGGVLFEVLVYVVL